MGRGQVPLTCSQANKQEKIFYERCDSNMSFVQKKGNKIIVVDEASESTASCRWKDVTGEREFQIFGKRLAKKNLVLAIEQKSGLSLNWRPLVDL